MAARYILAALSVAFAVAAIRRLSQTRDVRHPQTRTWLLIAAIFGGISLWLFYSG